MVSAGEIFGPSRPAQDGAEAAAPLGWPLFKRFYRDPIAWVAVLVTGAFTAYAGGAVMFWVHSVKLGEGGPNIPPAAHWALDSTAGFFGLTPALAFVLPLAVQFAGRRPRPHVRTGVYVATAGAAFAVLTVPGPIMHDLLVARDTWLGNAVTQALGPGGGPEAPPKDVPTMVSIGYQIVVGLPTYVLSIGLALLTVRLVVAAGRRIRPGPSQGVTPSPSSS